VFAPALLRFIINNTVVKPVGSSLPKLHHRRPDEKASPVVRTGNTLTGKPLFCLPLQLFNLGAILHNLTLGRCPSPIFAFSGRVSK